MSKLHGVLLSSAVFAAGLPIFFVSNALADSSGVEEVVVTAEKRSENIQKVPLAVSAFGETQIQDAAAHSITDFSAKVPNVMLVPVGAYPYASAFFIRGLGFADVESTYEPSVGTEVNGVYLARNSGANTDFFDIASIEILRGPQGTLYGRNTIGGVVSINTKKPTGDLDGEVQVTVGDHGRLETRAAADFPIADDLAGRVSFMSQNYDGYWKNDLNGRKLGGVRAFSGRATFAWTPSENFDATLVLDGDRERDDGPGFTNASLPTQLLSTLGFPAATGENYHVSVDGPLHENFNNYGMSLNMNWNVGFGTVTSVTGLRTFAENAASDFDGAPIPFFNADRVQTHHQFSEELRLASNPGGAIDYVVGGYFLHQRYHLVNTESGLVFGGLTVPEIAGQSNDAYAVFGQLDWHATDALTLTLGGRYSYESKDFTIQPLFYPTSGDFDHNWGNFSPKVGVSYQWTPDIMTYAQYQQGFRSGGFDGRAGSFSTVGPYGSEKVSSYEIGFKSQWFEHHLTVNGDVFFANYKSMQIGVQQFIGGTYQTVTKNVGSAHINGAELEAHALLTDGLTLDGSLGYLDSGFDKFMADLIGNGIVTDNSNLPFAYAPKWTASIGGTYSREIGYGVVTLNANLSYADKQYTSFSTYNLTSDFALRPSTALLDAAIAWSDPDSKYTVRLWGKNLTDKRYQNNTFPVGPLFSDRIYAAPLTFGLDVGVKF